jgi:hypothetical protein
VDLLSLAGYDQSAALALECAAVPEKADPAWRLLSEHLANAWGQELPQQLASPKTRLPEKDTITRVWAPPGAASASASPALVLWREAVTDFGNLVGRP